DYDIWIHDINGTYDDTSDDQDYVLLTRSVTSEVRPAWSPDGKTISFVTFGGSFGASAQIGSVPVALNPVTGHIEATGSVVMLTDNSFSNFDPSWSPDSNQIAYSTTRNGAKDIYRMSS